MSETERAPAGNFDDPVPWLELVGGLGEWAPTGPGLRTYPEDPEPGQRTLHAAMLRLHAAGLVKCRLGRDCAFWDITAAGYLRTREGREK